MTVTCPFNSKFRENLKSKSSIGMSFASNNKVGGQRCESTNRVGLEKAGFLVL